MARHSKWFLLWAIPFVFAMCMFDGMMRGWRDFVIELKFEWENASWL